jgi:hypothetical protein
VIGTTASVQFEVAAVSATASKVVAPRRPPRWPMDRPRRLFVSCWRTSSEIQCRGRP